MKDIELVPMNDIELVPMNEESTTNIYSDNNNMDDNQCTVHITPGNQVRSHFNNNHQDANNSKKMDKDIQGELDLNDIESDASLAYIQEKPQKKVGWFAGVYVPTCETMWGVIIFIRYGWIVGKAGVGTALLATYLSSLAVTLTAMSSSALLSNGKPREGGVYHILSRSLGPALGGSVSILYFFGLSIMAMVEIVGFTEGLNNVTIYVNNGYYLFGSENNGYADQLVFGSIAFIFCLIMIIAGHKPVHLLSYAFIVVLLLAYLAALSGLFASAGGWQVGLSNVTLAAANRSVAPETFVAEITGLKAESLKSNFYIDMSDFVEALTFIFPCFLGTFSGVNGATKIEKPHRNVPIGTFSSILTSTLLYSLIFILLGSAATQDTLAKDFLLFEEIAWPSRWVTTAGLLIVGIGAAMQLLMTAVDVLMNISIDEIVPILRICKFHSKYRGVPLRAIGVTFLIALPFLFVQDLELIATVVTLLFLLAYLYVNISCFTLSVMKAPHWRPKFRYYHYSTAFLGFALCTALMFTIAWIYALIFWIVTMVLAFLIEIYGGGNSRIWGHGLRGLQLQLGIQALLSFEQDAEHHRRHHRDLDVINDEDRENSNWTPHFLCFLKVPENLEDLDDMQIGPNQQEEDEKNNSYKPKRKNTKAQKQHFQEDSMGTWNFMRSFGSKMSKGLTIVANVVEMDGSSTTSTHLNDGEAYTVTRERKRYVQGVLSQEKVTGFTSIIPGHEFDQAAQILQYSAGLGYLKPNTVVTGWPKNWREKHSKGGDNLVSLIRDVRRNNKALLVVKEGTAKMPSKGKNKQKGNIDIWWIVQDGGMILLVAFMMKLNSQWKNCNLRLFTVIENDSDAADSKAKMKELLKSLRIQAEVHIVKTNDDFVIPFQKDVTVYQPKRSLRGSDSDMNNNGSKLCALVAAQHNEDKMKRIISIRAIDKMVEDEKQDDLFSSFHGKSSSNCASPEPSCSDYSSAPGLKLKLDDYKSDKHLVPRVSILSASVPDRIDRLRTQDVVNLPVYDPHFLQAIPKSIHNNNDADNNNNNNNNSNNNNNNSKIELDDVSLNEDRKSEGITIDTSKLKMKIELFSSQSAMVLMSLPIPGSAATSDSDKYMSMIENLMENIPRAVLVNGLRDGTNVLHAHNF